MTDLQKAEQALDQSEAGRRISEEKFQKIFHSSPIAFSITTFEEGRFLEVNAVFEVRYGYSRRESLDILRPSYGFGKILPTEDYC